MKGSVFFLLLFFISHLIFSQNPIAGNQSFQIISEGNFTSTNSHHIHGPLAVGGNLILNTPSMGEVNMDNTGSYIFPGDGSVPTGLLVKGGITWTNGTMRVNDGNYIHIGNSTGSISSNNGGTGLTQVLPAATSYNNAKRIEASVIQPTNVFQTVGFDFTSLFNSYRTTSTTLSTRTNNVQLYNSSNAAIAGNTVSTAQNVRINTLDFGVNYLNLTSTSLNNITEISFGLDAVPSATKILIINVPITANFVWNNSNMAGIAGVQGPYVLWNFYGATTYNLTLNTASMVVGTVFAPNMNFIKTGTGDTEGGIIAKTIQLGTGEIHNFQFASDLNTFDACSCTGNLLTNNSFENGVTGWSSSGGTAYNGTGYQVCGSNIGYLQATTANAWLWQQLSATSGTTYNLSFWAGTHEPSFTHYVRLGFYNSSNALIGSNQVNIDHDVDISNNLSFYSLAATAPANTSYMRVEAFANGDFIKIDQVCLSNATTSGMAICTPPAVSASSNSPVFAGTTINLSSTSVGGNGAQLVVNGDFSNGNNSFSSDYSLGPGYNITTNSQTVWGWAINCVNPNGNMMVGDGNGNINSRFWYQSINVTAGTTYSLSFRAYDFWGGTLAAKLQWGVNGTKIGAISNLSSGGCNTWQQISTTWTATTTGTVVFAIYNNEPSGGNNDFAIDDISIVATGPTTYSWSGPSGFSSSSQNPTIPSASTSMSGIYTITSSVGGCAATATTNVTVNTSTFSCSGSCESANLVVNPQFEIDMSAWTASNGQLTRGGGGTYGSFLEVNVGDLAGTYTAYQDVAFAANAPYRFIAYAAKHAVNNLPKMYLEFYNGTTYLSKTADIIVTKNYDGTFQLINFEGNTPANTTKIRIVGWTQNNALKFDNVSLVGCQACFAINSPASICVGQTTTLTASNCAGTVTWNTGATGSTITVSPTTTTTYTATCNNITNILNNPGFELGNLTAWNNWNNTTVTSVSTERYGGTFGARVNASAAGGGFAQDNVAVAGESFTLKVWGRVSSASPWSGIGVKFMNSSFTSLSDVSAEVNATAFQEYTVTNTAPAGTAWVQVYAWTDPSTILYLDNFSLVKTSTNTSATTTVTVNTSPTATATGDTECVGATITLGSTGGGTYAWTGPASFASTLQNPTRASATTAMAGIYTVTVTSTNGCTATATANVTVNNGTVPSATVGSTGCTGSTGSITVTNLPDGFSTNINGGAWTAYRNSYVDLAAGTYTIGYQGNGCNTYANFTVTTSTDNPLLSLTKTDPTCSTTGSVTVTGSGGTTGLGDATYQLWYGISGNLVSNLTSNANYPNTPSLSTLVGIAEGYNNAVDNVGGRISGYIVPPTTGTYYFWVASDDYSEFWGSGDANPANKVLLASVTGYTGYREWNKYTSQKTAAVNLTAGQIYYFEVLYKEGTGGDNVSLGWSKPGEATTVPSEVIPGKYLRPNVASSTTTPVYQYRIGGGAFQTGNVFTGLAAGTYTVTIQDAGGCTATSTIALAITGGTPAPTGTGGSRCGSGTVTLSAAGCTGASNWYAAPTGGTSLGTGATFLTPSISITTTYFVDCTVSSCVSSRTAVTATVTPVPSAPTTSGSSRCGTGSVTLSASGCTGVYNWYGNPTGGTSLGTGSTYSTPSISNTTTYYVDCTVNSCGSSRASVVATINPQPSSPTASGSRCGPGSVVLAGSGCSGTYNWYAASTGGASLGSSSTYTTPSISASTTYFLSCTVGSCMSSIVPVVATINAIPTATASSNSPIVVGGTLNLFSTGGTTYTWSGPNGFASTSQDVSIATITPSDAGVYTVTANTNGCTASATTQITINNYDPGDINCSLVSTLNFSNYSLISGTAGANNAQYRFSNVTSGTDAIVTILSRSHADIEINELDVPAASFGGYNEAFQPMIDYNWINGPSSYDAPGEKSITFKFDFVQSGTTTPRAIPNLLATGLDIDGSTNEVREFIQASNYQSYQIQTPSSLTLSGALKAKGPLTTYAGINELALDAMISYAYINSSSITVTYGADWNGSTADFGDTAPGNSDEKRLNSLYFKCYNFNTTVCTLPLAAPTSTGANRCGTGPVTLSASGCTGTYYWYTTNTGGLAVGVGNSFTTPSLSSTTTYFVECNAVGCTSARTAVVATIRPAIIISKVLGDSECLNSEVNLGVTVTGGTNLTYNWTGPNSFASTLQNPTRASATATMAGTYSVTVSNAEGCAATATTTVTVSNLPTSSITGTTTICNGQATTLTASGGNYYIWSDGSTSAAITVNPAVTTSYSVTVFQNNVSNTDLVSNVTDFNVANFSFINATNSFGTPATLFDDVDNLNAETFHATRTSAGADWGISYNLGGNFLINNLSIDRRNDCCTDRAEGGVMQVWRNGTMVYQSNILNSAGDGLLSATPAPNVIGNEIRYVFLAGANTLTGESILNFTEWNIGGTKLCSTNSTATVTVNAIPSAPTSLGASRCGAGLVTMTASGCAGG
ncbi:MAG: collagen-binding domain-containing protein, partial [Emticicia sp.]|uniref:Ig-like domain-containing protein n=1 Tax=Emticicia sp. TaxID=1930953 RepID=UPI003BA5E8FE